MSQIKDVLQPLVDAAEHKYQTKPYGGHGCNDATHSAMQTAKNMLIAVSQLDTNLDLLRANVQSLLDDCAHILNRRTNGIKLQHEWDGISLNAVRDIKQRAGVMLALLDGEEI